MKKPARVPSSKPRRGFRLGGGLRRILLTALGVIAGLIVLVYLILFITS